jgi:hypothetical protein
MATTTPNFGWAVPTSTDLVKDGAVAIETLGDSIDASLVDLKGGTTNQVLAKNSNTDMDFKWVSDATGMTNPMTTTGDTIYSSSGSTPARLGIGSTGQVLTVASGVPSWATPAGTAFSGAFAKKTVGAGDQTISNGTWTTLTFTAEDFDTDNYHDNSTNTGRLTVPSTGYYVISGLCQWNAVSSTNGRHHRIIKNGGTDLAYKITNQGSQALGFDIAILVNLTASDYVEFQVYQDSGSSLTVSWSEGRTFFNIQKVG